MSRCRRLFWIEHADTASGPDCPLIWRNRTQFARQGWSDHMGTDDLTNRLTIRGDPDPLTEAAAALRSARSEQIFEARFPGEYIMSGIARLLDSLAREMRDNGDLGHEVVSAATEMSRHILTYLPRIEKRQ
jgi:hypothetical protein